MRESIGTSLISTLRHSRRSSSGVRVGGGGKLDSPPKSTLAVEMLSRFSSVDGTDAFSSIMMVLRKDLGSPGRDTLDSCHFNPTHDSNAAENDWSSSCQASFHEDATLFLGDIFRRQRSDDQRLGKEARLRAWYGRFGVYRAVENPNSRCTTGFEGDYYGESAVKTL